MQGVPTTRKRHSSVFQEDASYSGPASRLSRYARLEGKLFFWKPLCFAWEASQEGFEAGVCLEHTLIPPDKETAQLPRSTEGVRWSEAVQSRFRRRMSN